MVFGAFKSAERNAFQVTFGGVALLSDEVNLNGSAPLPMFTWFYRL